MVGTSFLWSPSLFASPLFPRRLFSSFPPSSFFSLRLFIKISLQFFLIRHTFEKACSHYLLFSPTFFDDHSFIKNQPQTPHKKNLKLKLMVTFLKIKINPFKNQQTPDNRSPHPLYSLTNSVTNKYTNIYKLFKRL